MLFDQNLRTTFKLKNQTPLLMLMMKEIFKIVAKIIYIHEVCYRKHGFPPHFGKKQVLANSYSTDNDDSHQSNVDSWSNDNVCFSLHFFHSYYKIKPISVFLPNDSSLLEKYAYTDIFSPRLYITHVLFTHEFSLNLISKLGQSLNCTIQFFWLNMCIVEFAIPIDGWFG